jgi:hypothetical protein
MGIIKIALIYLAATSASFSADDKFVRRFNSECDVIKALTTPMKPVSSIGLFAKIGIDLSKVKSKNYVALSEPAKLFHRDFVIRSVNFGSLKLEISSFENKFGISSVLRGRARSEGVWNETLEKIYALGSTNKGLSFTDFFPLQSEVTGNLEIFAKLGRLASSDGDKSWPAISSYLNDIGSFIDKQEQRRGWNKEMYDFLKSNGKRFNGSSTNLVIRDQKTNAIVATLKMVRAPFGGLSLITKTSDGYVEQIEIGTWGPLYKRLAAPDPTLMFQSDAALFHQGDYARKLGLNNHTILPHEVYVPEEFRMRRESLPGSFYMPYRHPSYPFVRQMGFFWQKEFIEPSGFAVDKKYSLSADARKAILTAMLGFLMEPDALSSMAAVDQYILFPNDKVGIELYKPFGLKPVKGPFEIFGMKDWSLLGATREEFQSAIENILNMKDQDLDEFARKFFNGL